MLQRRRPVRPENLFVEVFQEAVGFLGAQWLQFQVGFTDIDQHQRRIDYALHSPLGRYSFEVDGEFWHDPSSARVTPDDFRSTLTRQNSLIHQGWKVYRWTDQQLLIERSRVVEQLRLFLEREIAAGTLGDLLPLQDAGEFSLREHQSAALERAYPLLWVFAFRPLTQDFETLRRKRED